jgi:hypothetical protein
MRMFSIRSVQNIAVPVDRSKLTRTDPPSSHDQEDQMKQTGSGTAQKGN